MSAGRGTRVKEKQKTVQETAPMYPLGKQLVPLTQKDAMLEGKRDAE